MRIIRLSPGPPFYWKYNNSTAKLLTLREKLLFATVHEEKQSLSNKLEMAYMRNFVDHYKTYLEYYYDTNCIMKITEKKTSLIQKIEAFTFA